MNAGSPAAGRPTPPKGALYRLGHWCARHFVVVIALWLAAMVGLQITDRAVGGQYSDDFDLPGVQSAEGLDVLRAHDPAAGGYAAQIVLNRPSGPLTDEASAVNSTVAALEKLPDVRGEYDRPSPAPP
ncbi:hypothetical protein [Streptomyces sp. NPDC048266]|uniref:hypothetical protein n=1 Tax=Streptomyces sp. NPDC048266 TaxID=3155787 RepID=UPI0033C2CE2D